MKRIEVSDQTWLISKLWKWDNIEHTTVLVSEKHTFKSTSRSPYTSWIVFIEWGKWLPKWRHLKTKLKRTNVFIWSINGRFFKKRMRKFARLCWRKIVSAWLTCSMHVYVWTVGSDTIWRILGCQKIDLAKKYYFFLYGHKLIISKLFKVTSISLDFNLNFMQLSTFPYFLFI